VETTIVERVNVEAGLKELGLTTAESQANFSWVDLGEASEEEVVQGLEERRVLVRAGAALGGPGHIRVTYGTHAENERFLAALGEILD
jgi:histidinol-phosphate aminotransferase